VATKRIKFIKAWMMVPVGAEMDFDAPVADLLIQRGRAVEVLPPEPITMPAPTPTSAKVSKKSARRGARNAKLHR
jgi:hypothetical protein